MQACFPVNFAKFLRTPFTIEHVWWLLLHTKLIMIETELFLSYENPMSMPWIRFSRNKMSMNSYKQSNLLFRDQRSLSHSYYYHVQRRLCISMVRFFPSHRKESSQSACLDKSLWLINKHKSDTFYSSIVLLYANL